MSKNLKEMLEAMKQQALKDLEVYKEYLVSKQPIVDMTSDIDKIRTDENKKRLFAQWGLGETELKALQEHLTVASNYEEDSAQVKFTKSFVTHKFDKISEMIMSLNSPRITPKSFELAKPGTESEIATFKNILRYCETTEPDNWSNESYLAWLPTSSGSS